MKRGLKFQARRWSDFRRRAAYAPQDVYRHETHGWEYIPIHPFGDEPKLLARLQMRPEQCLSVDAWWGIDGDATLLQSSIAGVFPGAFARVAGFGATVTEHPERWVYLTAVFDAPFVTRAAFEGAMVRFAEMGFPHGPLFVWRKGVRSLPLPP